MKTNNAVPFDLSDSSLFPSAPKLTSAHFVAISLRDQIRQARKFGVSMECLPLPAAYDEDEYALDPNADLRVSRFDRADLSMQKSTKDRITTEAQMIAAGQSPMDPAPSTAPQTAPAEEVKP